MAWKTKEIIGDTVRWCTLSCCSAAVKCVRKISFIASWDTQWERRRQKWKEKSIPNCPVAVKDGHIFSGNYVSVRYMNNSAILIQFLNRLNKVTFSRNCLKDCSQFANHLSKRSYRSWESRFLKYLRFTVNILFNKGIVLGGLGTLCVMHCCWLVCFERCYIQDFVRCYLNCWVTSVDSYVQRSKIFSVQKYHQR